MQPIPIPAPVSGGLMLTYRCSAACRHCMYACSPRWPADWMSEADVERGLAALARYIQPSPFGPEGVSLNHGLHFTGGEPFLNYDLLLHATRVAAEVGVPSTFVETNAFWCASEETTREKLEALREAGLRGIMISVNPFFAEFVPFERTERAVRGSLDVFGRNVFVYQQTYWREFRSLGVRGTLSVEEYVERTGNRQFIRRAELFLSGRATWALRHAFPA
ncbi:MAG: radical SAM protein, partial [Planctomycetota bacterium]